MIREAVACGALGGGVTGGLFDVVEDVVHFREFQLGDVVTVFPDVACGLNGVLPFSFVGFPD